MTRTDSYTHGELPILFSFLEGQFGYNCNDCVKSTNGVTCCREAGRVYATPKQMEKLSTANWAPLIDGENNGLVNINLGLGGCPALNESGRCNIEIKLGRRAKPALCAMFPFSNIVRTDSFLAISPVTTFVCPITVAEKPGDHHTSYQSLCNQLTLYYDNSLELFPKIKLPEIDAVTIENERELLDSVNTSRGSHSVIEALCGASGRKHGDLANRIDQAITLVGWELLNDDIDFAAQFLPLVPTLRTSAFEMPTTLIDSVILFGLQHLLRLANLSSERLSGRQMTNAFNQILRLAKTMCRCHFPVSLKNTPKRSAGGDPEAALETLLILHDIDSRPGEYSLWDLIKKHAHTTGWRRMIVLQALAREDLTFDYGSTP